jgi:group II intron reverse transcriptase/maturase
MKVRYRKEMANHSGPESCGSVREGETEALAGETGRPAIEPRNQESGMPTLLSEAEGHTGHGDNRKSCHDPARSKTLSMPGSLLNRNWEVSWVPAQAGGTGKAPSRKPGIDAHEKSDTPIVPEKPLNKGEELAEGVEGRGVAKGNADPPPASRTQSRTLSASMGLEGLREKARRDRRVRFTALLHHVTPTLLIESFYALKRQAAVGVDGMTWREYEKILDGRVHELHRRIQTGKYRALPSRRVFIPKADGRQRPLGIASVEDKIVQQAISTILGMIYEQDFLGFSYGFRPGRGQHDALDALCVGIKQRKVNWILDADIRSFFDEIDHDWMMRFLEHRVADKRVLRLIRNWLKAGVVEDGRRSSSERGTPQGAVISPLLANIYLHYVLDLWAHQWRRRAERGDVIIVRYADDSVMGFQYESQARRFLAALRSRMAHFGLALHPEKTRLIRFGRFAEQDCREAGRPRPETFDFLGFTHCCGYGRQGRFQVVRLTVKKRMRAKLAALRETLMRRRHEPIPLVGDWLRRVLQGYFNYYAIHGNLKRLEGFRHEVCRAWRHALMRRSQRHRVPWERFNRLTRHYVPNPRLVHPYPEERLHVTTQGRSRMR